MSVSLKVKLITLKRGLLSKLQAAGLSAGEPAVIWDDTAKPRLAVGDRDGVPREVVGTAHSHALGEVTGLELALAGKASSSHSHPISDVTGLATALAGKADTTHTHAISDTTGLQDALDAKVSAAHSHEILDITGLQTALGGKEPSLGNPSISGMVPSSDTSGNRNWVPNGTIIKLQEITLTEDTPSVLFSDISQNYTNLKLHILARGSVSSVGVDVCIRFNGDSSGNYDRTYLYSNNTHGNGYEYAQINGVIGYIAADLATTNYAGFVDALIPFYAKTTFNKIVRGHSSASVNATSQTNQAITATQWRSTAAINSILVYPLSGSFKAGSTFVLYGEK